LRIASIAWEALIPVIGRANRELSRFDGLLHGIPNPAVLLSPITTQNSPTCRRWQWSPRSFDNSPKPAF
jgi:hypothetical protein